MLTSSIISCANQGLDTFTGESESGNNSGNTGLDANDDNKKDNNNDDAADDEDESDKESDAIDDKIEIDYDNTLNNDSMTEAEKEAAAKKKEQNDNLLAELMPKYEALRSEIKNATSGSYYFGKETANIGTPPSAWNATLPTITESHPRLLLTKSTIPTVRKSLKEDNPTNKRYYELIDKDISTINNGKLESVSQIDFGTNTNKPTYDGRTGKHNYRKDYLEFIQIKALGYLVEGHDLYGYQAIHCMKQFLRTLDIQYITSNMEREYGNTMFTAALVYDWCYDLLTTEDKNQLRAGIENRTASGKCGYPSYTTTTHYQWKMSVGFPPYSDPNRNKVGAISGHGSERQVLRDYLSVAIAFYGDNNSWWNYIGKLVYSEYVPVRNYYFQSGIAPQGIGVYVSGRHISDMYSAWMLKTATGSQPYPNIDKTIRNFLGYECAPGKLFSDGDGTGSIQNNYELKSLSYMTAYIFADKAMLAQAKDMESSKAFASDTIELTSAMYVALAGMSDITPASNKYEGMELIQYNGSPVGQYITHEAWNDANSASVFMKIKELSSANHEHADAGNFMIYYKGMLTADAGVYSNYGSDHTRYYHQATISHNSLLIDNGSQNSDSTDKKVKFYSGGQIWPAEISAASNVLKAWTNSADHKTGVVIGNEHGYYDSAKTQPKYAYIGGDISGAYPSGTAEFVGRRMLVVYTGNEDAPMLFFTYDTIKSVGASYKKTYLLHTPTQPTISGKTVTVENGGGRLVLTCLSNNVEVKSVGGRTYGPNNKLDDSASKNYYIHGYGQVPINYDDGTWGRVEITNTNNGSVISDTDTKILNAMYVTDAGSTKSYTMKPISNVSTNLTAGDFEGGVFNGSVAAIFAKKRLISTTTRLEADKTYSFTTEGGSSIDYYIDGMATGKWSVTVNGTSIGEYTVSSSGLLTFSAPSGNVVLKKVS